MADSDPLAYVTAAAPLLGLHLCPKRLAELAAAFAQVQRFAAPALLFEPPPETPPAAVFVP